MPRRRKYTTAAQKREADRLKSYRYYHREHDRVLRRKKELRAEHRSALKRSLQRSRSLHEQEKAAVELKRATERGLPEDPNSGIVNAEALLARELKPFSSLAKFFDSIVEKLLRWDRDDPLLRPLLSPLARPFRFFRGLHDDVESNTEQILQHGTSSQYARAEALLIRLVKIVDAIECLEQDTFNGTLQQKYVAEELKSQNTLWRAAVDGIRGAEAWNYQG
ncbi:hypothetical protein VNI00_019109 [Paramarasmius palmivorus]|uniref:Uncharacterized protein n=1 Tax=Paramarasmius palmivorus TaxID=297713 RepID=A0AAW0ASI6_9AGAR